MSDEFVWRPSMFAPIVVHITREGSTAYTSERYPGLRFIHAACGQDTSIDETESFDSIRCPECAIWLKGQEGDRGPAASV